MPCDGAKHIEIKFQHIAISNFFHVFAFVNIPVLALHAALRILTHTHTRRTRNRAGYRTNLLSLRGRMRARQLQWHAMCVGDSGQKFTHLNRTSSALPLFPIQHSLFFATCCPLRLHIENACGNLQPECSNIDATSSLIDFATEQVLTRFLKHAGQSGRGCWPGVQYDQFDFEQRLSLHI